MSRHVYKYRLAHVAEANDERTSPYAVVSMPLKAKILTVEIQNGDVCLWAEIDDADPGGTILRNFAVIGTGWSFEKGTYIKTVFFGALVFHIYDLGVNLDKGTVLKEPK